MMSLLRVRVRVLSQATWEGEGEFTDEKIIQSNHTTCFDSCLGYQSSGMLRTITTTYELVVSIMGVRILST